MRPAFRALIEVSLALADRAATKAGELGIINLGKPKGSKAFKFGLKKVRQSDKIQDLIYNKFKINYR